MNRATTFFLIVFLFLTGCSEIKGTSYDSSSEPSPSLGAAVFPHLAGWEKPEGHGQYVIDNGTKDCANACHGEDLNGGSARGCKTCHTTYPHPAPEEWQGLEGHGKFVISAGSSDDCTKACHADDTSRPCTKCHASYPAKHNDASWSEKNHGAFVKESGSSKECSTMCHRQDVPEELKIKTCADCHPSYPTSHEDIDWGGSGKHKEFISQYGGIASSDCTTCHGEDLTGGSSGISCVTSVCHHKGGANAAEWKDKTEHGAAASADISKCTACHEQDLKGNSVAVGCDTCHHKNWAGEKPWADASEHGQFGAKPATTCKVCHGGDLSGGLAGINCTSCHGDIYPHSNNWSDKKQHGLTAKGGLDKCKSCHGELTSPDCRSCHHDGKPTWLSAAHKAQAKADTTGCKVCHGADLKGGESSQSCYDCHDPGNAYTHPNNWGEAFNHGIEYQTTPSDCKTACHGKDLKGGIAKVACGSCHTYYPHTMTMWDTKHGAQVLTSSDDFKLNGFDTNCSGCHGPIYTHSKDKYPGNMNLFEQIELYEVFDAASGKVSTAGRCYKCHFAYPHVKGIDPSTGTEKTWKTVHKKIAFSWGNATDPKPTCVKGNSCHATKRKSVYMQNKTEGVFCSSYCHKK